MLFREMSLNFRLAIPLLLLTTIKLAAAPQFTNVIIRNASIVLNGTSSVTNGEYILMTSTNLSQPLTNWTMAVTSSFEADGRFALTNAMNPAARQQFFALQTVPALNNFWIPACGALLGAAVTNGSAQNFSNHEGKTGRSLDVLRIYHTPGSWTHLTTAELNFINAGYKLLESVKPSSQWSNAVGVASGGSATVDSQMTSLAQSIASIQPKKIMLIVWHEPQNDVIGSVPSAKAGTTVQYVEMWHNVRSIFDANRATNVIWCWDVQGYAPLRYLIPSLWPGNAYVDWVMWDEYQNSAGESFTNTLQSSYGWMTTNSTPANNYLSKPWGLAEWGIGINSYYPTVAQMTNGINQMTAALNVNHQFPNLKLVEYYDALASAILPGAWGAYSNFANSPYMTQQCPH